MNDQQNTQMKVFKNFDAASSFSRINNNYVWILELILDFCVIYAPKYAFKSPKDKLYWKHFQTFFSSVRLVLYTLGTVYYGWVLSTSDEFFISLSAVVHVVTGGLQHWEHHFRRPTYHLPILYIHYSFMKVCAMQP